MKIKRKTLLQLGFQEELENYCLEIPTVSEKMPNLQLDWDSGSGLWLTDTRDPMTHLFLDLNHLKNIAQLVRFYFLLTGKQLVFQVD